MSSSRGGQSWRVESVDGRAGIDVAATDCAACGAVMSGSTAHCLRCSSADVWPVLTEACERRPCADPRHRPGTSMHVMDSLG